MRAIDVASAHGQGEQNRADSEKIGVMFEKSVDQNTESLPEIFAAKGRLNPEHIRSEALKANQHRAARADVQLQVVQAIHGRGSRQGSWSDVLQSLPPAAGRQDRARPN